MVAVLPNLPASVHRDLGCAPEFWQYLGEAPNSKAQALNPEAFVGVLLGFASTLRDLRYHNCSRLGKGAYYKDVWT